VNQVLNFGRPAPIDIRVTGPSNDKDFALAKKLVADLKHVPGVVDAHVFQCPMRRRCRSMLIARWRRSSASRSATAASSLLVSLNNSAQTSPNFWLNPNKSVSYRWSYKHRRTTSITSRTFAPFRSPATMWITPSSS